MTYYSSTTFIKVVVLAYIASFAFISILVVGRAIVIDMASTISVVGLSGSAAYLGIRVALAREKLNGKLDYLCFY